MLMLIGLKMPFIFYVFDDVASSIEVEYCYLTLTLPDELVDIL